jgi:hypothetical protein
MMTSGRGRDCPHDLLLLYLQGGNPSGVAPCGRSVRILSKPRPVKLGLLVVATIEPIGRKPHCDRNLACVFELASFVEYAALNVRDLPGRTLPLPHSNRRIDKDHPRSANRSS